MSPAAGPDGAGQHALAELVRSMDPLLDDRRYVVLTGPHELDVRSLAPFATVVEHEGTTVVIDAQRLDDALELGCSPHDAPPMCRITLRVHSSLLAVGLTAAVSSALAVEDISCNVVAGHFHDHLLVPADRGEDALRVLQALQAHPPAT